MIDNRTEHLDLPLPHPDNLMKSEDVPRIIAALQAIDSAIFSKPSMADITAAINSLLDGAPAALDTLNELAAAINDDASFAASVTAALAGKASVTHTHEITEIIGLVSALASKLETIPMATPSTMGGFKLGSGFVQDVDGTLSVVGGGGGGGSGLPAWSDQVFTPTGGQTSFTVSGGYVAGQIDVQLNGVTLIGNGDDYTAANGTTVVLTTGANTTDKLVVRKWFYLPSANAVNKTGDTMTGAINEAHGADIASAASVNLNVATGNLVDITGVVAITSIVLADGAERMVRFTGALTLTNSANLVLPGGANITTAAGDFAIFRGYAAGVVRCAVYTRANGQAVVSAGLFTGGTLTSALNYASTATIASAATTDIGAATSNSVIVSGAATITALGSIAAGVERIVTFAAALTLTHNGTSLILPGASNIITAAGDVAYLVSLGGGNWRCTNYERANAQHLSDSRSADVASAATINLTTGSGKVVDVTGTTAITAITLADGAERVVRFTGVLTLTNGANLVLPSGANITTAAGDFAIFRGYAGSVVRCVMYSKANGQAIVSPAAFTGGTLSSALNYAPLQTLASAATVNLGTATSNFVEITGTTGITSFGTITDGAERFVKFVSAGLTLTHNATSLILPCSANIVTEAGDTAIFMSLGGGNWRCMNYSRISGRANNEFRNADVASAATINLTAGNGNLVDVTGSVAITAITLADGAERTIRFTGALTLTNGASLVLPGGANIITAAGDFAVFRGYSGGIVRCVMYSKANGQAVVAPAAFTGGTLSSALNYAPIATIASATTTDIGVATSNAVNVTGTTTITSLGTIAGGAERVVMFAGALTLTHNAASLILPTGSNIITAVGDVAYFVSLGAGNWRCAGYLRASGRALTASVGPDVASAANINLNTNPTDVVDVTGTTAILGITLDTGAEKVVRFTGALTLTNSANLVLPGGANITTAAGDFAIFRGYAAGVVRCVVYTRANGQALITTPFTGGTLTSALNYASTATIASAATTDIGAATSNSVIVSGAATITALGTIAAGAERVVTFSGALTLTHNATSLILPGAANITTAAGDVAYFVSLGGVNWRCTSYQRATGRSVFEQSIASWLSMYATTTTNTFVVPAGVSKVRAYSIGKGGNGANGGSSSGGGSGGGGGGCAYGEFNVTPGTSITCTISAGVATVTYNSTTMLTGNPGGNGNLSGVGGTGGTASKDASVANGGAFSGGAGGTQNTAGGGGTGGGSAGSPLGNGYTGGVNGTGSSAGYNGGAGGGAGIGGNGGGGGNTSDATASGGGGGGAGGAGGLGRDAGYGGGGGGGAGGAASPNGGIGGPSRTLNNAFTDPLLSNMMQPGASNVLSTGAGIVPTFSASAGPGGGGAGGSRYAGGDGGDGGGGGGAGAGGSISDYKGGNGGLLGGGGGSATGGSSTTIGGTGGIGGGGGGAGPSTFTTVGGTGGSAGIFIFY